MTKKRLPVKIKMLLGAACMLAAPAVAAPGSGVQAASNTPKVVAPVPYERWAGVANQWTRNFRITGDASARVTVGVSVGSPTSRDSVSFPVNTGLTLSFGFASWSSMKSIAFSGTVANVNRALASARLSTVSAGKTEMKVLVTEYEPNLSFQPANGHFYEFVPSPRITWTAAKDAAEARTFRGVKGYLATVTDQRENNFVAQSIPNARNVWLGGSDAETEGVWKWATGPEKGTTFMTMTCATKTGADACDGANVLKTPGSTSSQYSDTAVFDVASRTYAAWAFLEPNNWGTTGEDYVATNWQGTSGEWNDLADSTAQISGYVVEYSGASGKPMPKVYSASTTITKVPVRFAPMEARTSVSGSSRVITWRTHPAAKPASVRVVAMPGSRTVCSGTVRTRCVDRAARSQGARYYLVTYVYGTRPSVHTAQKAFTMRVNVPR